MLFLFFETSVIRIFISLFDVFVSLVTNHIYKAESVLFRWKLGPSILNLVDVGGKWKLGIFFSCKGTAHTIGPIELGDFIPYLKGFSWKLGNCFTLFVKYMHLFLEKC